MKTKILSYILDVIRNISSIVFLKRLIIGLFIVGLIVLSGPWITNTIAQVFYSRGSYSMSTNIWSTASKVSLQERDIMYANAGNSLYKQTKLPEAIDKYEKAVELAPESRQCKIRWNMSTALLSLAKSQESSDEREAISSYSRILFALNNDACLNQPENRNAWEERIKYVEDKIELLNRKTKEKQQNTIQYDPNSKEPTEEERTLKRLENLNRSRQEEADTRYYEQDEEAMNNSYGEDPW